MKFLKVCLICFYQIVFLKFEVNIVVDVRINELYDINEINDFRIDQPGGATVGESR